MELPGCNVPPEGLRRGPGDLCGHRTGRRGAVFHLMERDVLHLQDRSFHALLHLVTEIGIVYLHREMERVRYAVATAEIMDLFSFAGPGITGLHRAVRKLRHVTNHRHVVCGIYRENTTLIAPEVGGVILPQYITIVSSLYAVGC